MSKHSLYQALHREYCSALFEAHYFKLLESKISRINRIVINGGLVVNVVLSILLARDVVPDYLIWVVTIISLILVFRSWFLPSKAAVKLVRDNLSYYSRLERRIINLAKDVHDKRITIAQARLHLDDIISSSRSYADSEPLDTGLSTFMKLKERADSHVIDHEEDLYIAYYGENT